MIDIFIPFWGKPEQLYQAVESVRTQTSQDWRLTVVDDGYPEDVSGYFEKLDDPRIRYMRNEENLGVIGNYTKCQEMAEGDYTVLLGCDDAMLPNYVTLIENTARLHPGVDIIQPGVQVIDDTGRVYLPLADRVKEMIRPRGKGTVVIQGEAAAQSLLLGDWLYWPSLAFKTDTLKSVKLDPELPIVADLGFILDMIQSGARLAVSPDVVFSYRRHSTSLSSASIGSGQRFGDERSFFETRAKELDRLGWRKAARSARLHLSSRAYALTELPRAVRSRTGVKEMLTHVFR